jgi:hypothetical protein
VTHTKDDILWFGDDQEQVEDALKEATADYISIARERRRGDEAADGPSELEIQAAVDELQAELTSSEMADLVTIDELPAPEVVETSIQPVLEEMEASAPDFSAEIGPLVVHGYMANDLSPNDPYVVSDSAHEGTVVVVVNMRHPHFGELRGSDGVLNFLRHCVYDSLAEWKVRRNATAPDPDTIRLVKDGLLRISMKLEMHRP